MNIHKDARLLKTDHTSSRGKTIINTVCLTTVSWCYDRDPDPSVAIVALAVLSSLEIARFPCCLNVIALTFTWTVILFPKTSDFSVLGNTKTYSQHAGGKGERGIQRPVRERTISKHISRGLIKTGLGWIPGTEKGSRWQRGSGEDKLLDLTGKTEM